MLGNELAAFIRQGSDNLPTSNPYLPINNRFYFECLCVYACVTCVYVAGAGAGRGRGRAQDGSPKLA